MNYPTFVSADRDAALAVASRHASRFGQRYALCYLPTPSGGLYRVCPDRGRRAEPARHPGRVIAWVTPAGLIEKCIPLTAPATYPRSHDA